MIRFWLWMKSFRIGLINKGESMKVIWEVSDGYVGKSRPQYANIADEDLEGLSEQEKMDFIEEFIQQEFENNIGWEISSIIGD